MKRFALYIGITTALIASCSVQEEDFKAPVQDDVIFHASFEQPTEETRVFANKDLLLRWTADDRVSIFNKTTINQEFRFSGQTGDSSGEFVSVGNSSASGRAISHIVSVYPYQESTSITTNEQLLLSLPSEQIYAENSFGLGANTMVSFTSDNYFLYKNVCGYLALSLFGEGVSVSSIKLKGNNYESLAGQAWVTVRGNGNPSVSLTSDIKTEITLTCLTPIQLGEKAEESTRFWFVIPPMTFSNGFTITITDSMGRTFVQSTSKDITIQRNTLSKMAPLEVAPSYHNNCILYTTKDGNIISPYSINGFNSQLVSNEYINGIGLLTFEQDVSTIGSWAFYGCDNLISITLPESVTRIGGAAFYQCSNLTSISLPDGISTIANYAFADCSSLTEIVLPKQLTTIEHNAFNSCSSLLEIILPESLSSIGEFAFANCSGLTNISVLPKTPPTGGRLMFDSTNNCPIYVPTESIEAYMSAQYWSDYASRILPVSAVPVISVSLNKNSLELSLGKSETLVATIYPDNATNKSVTWSSSNPSVATVSATGEVKAKAIGTTIITVRTNDGGKTATCSVTVTAEIISVTGVSISPNSLSMAIGDTQTLFAKITPTDATDITVSWSSSNTLVADVSSSGIVTAKAVGTTTVTARTNDGGLTASCVVSVIDVTKYQAGDKAYVGTCGDYPSPDIILAQSECYPFDANSTIVSPRVTGTYFWVVIPYGYSLERANNLDFSGDYIPGSGFRKEPIVLNARLYNRFYLQSTIPFNSTYELYFTKDN